MKRLALLFAALFVFVPTAAMAATSSDDATFTVDVPTAISITFSDDQAAFSAVLPGSIVDQTDTLAYTVQSNAPAGFSVDLNANAGNTIVNGTGLFYLSTNNFATVTNVSNGAIGNGWRTQNAAGTFNYFDDVRVDVPSDAPAASYSAVVTYTATTL